MQIEEYLKTYQPVIYHTFARSLQNDRLSHAYLIYGNNGTPLFEVAKFLAKSILCDDKSPLACDNCITCLRVDDNNYPDMVIYDGRLGSIKKQDIASLEEDFNKEALDAKGIKIYILNLIENMTDEAINSLLKFLEEPHPNIFAFLTTNNIYKILPTIISRCQNFQLKSIERSAVIRDAISLGIEQEDAEFLSYFYNEPNLILEKINDKDVFTDYKLAKDSLLKILNTFIEDKRKALFIMQSEISPNIRDTNTLKIFLDLLSQIMTDVINLSSGYEVTLKCQSELLESLNNKIEKPGDVLIELLKIRGAISLSVNPLLILDHIIFTLMEEKYGSK